MAARKKIEVEHTSDEELPPRQIVEDSDEPKPGTIAFLRKQAEGLHQAAKDKVTAAKEVLHSAEAELEEVESFMGLSKTSSAPTTSRSPRAPSESTGRVNSPRGYWQGKIKEALDGKTDGLKKADLVEAAGVKGDAKGTANLSSALQQMKKAGEVTQNDGMYMLP